MGEKVSYFWQWSSHLYATNESRIPVEMLVFGADYEKKYYGKSTMTFFLEFQANGCSSDAHVHALHQDSTQGVVCGCGLGGVGKTCFICT